MENKKKLKKGDIFRRPDGTQIGYFQFSHDFIKWQCELKGSSVKVYNCLVQQAGIQNTLKVAVSESKLITWTGIKDKATISSAIRDLVENGWIKNILVQIDNSNLYIINLEKQKPNVKLLEWLDERAKKNSQNSKKLLAEGKIVKGKDGKFQKVNNDNI